MKAKALLLVVVVLSLFCLFGVFFYSSSFETTKTPLQLAVFKTTYKNNSNTIDIIQLLNTLKSPPNQIPKRYTNGSEMFEKMKKQRGTFYGGGGVDEKHLGGFLNNDSKSYERELWEYIIPEYNINSVMDIGCGRGVSTLFFASKIQNYIKWNNVLCIEGSHDAIQKSFVKNITVQHDYSMGPYWPDRIFDMAWSIEFLEHVNESFMSNYMSTFKKAKLIVMTASPQGGWSHLNVHPKEYWIKQFESYGFIYDEALTKKSRSMCTIFPTTFSKYSYHALGDSKWGPKTKRQSYFHYNGLVFHNPYFYKQINIQNLKKYKHITLLDAMLLEKL